MAEKLFAVNMGRLDRGIRIIVGIALLALTFLGTAYWWGYIGILPLLTGLVGFCPAYTPFGINTRGREPKAQHTAAGAGR